MKKTFVTRRVDDLGRIVIPKDFRNNLIIKTGDILEISIFNNSILMKKHDLINVNDNFVNNLFNIFTKIINGNIYLTDNQKIVLSNNKNIIGLSIDNLIVSNSQGNIYLLKNNNIIKQPYKIYKLTPNGDFIGYLIFELFEENLNEMYMELLYKIIKNSFEK